MQRPFLFHFYFSYILFCKECSHKLDTYHTILQYILHSFSSLFFSVRYSIYLFALFLFSILFHDFLLKLSHFFCSLHHVCLSLFPFRPPLSVKSNISLHPLSFCCFKHSDTKFYLVHLFVLPRIMDFVKPMHHNNGNPFLIESPRKHLSKYLSSAKTNHYCGTRSRAFE